MSLVDGRLVSARFAAMADRERALAEQELLAQQREEALIQKRKEWKAKALERVQHGKEMASSLQRQAALRAKRESLLPKAPASTVPSASTSPPPALTREHRDLPPENSAYAKLLDRIAHRYREGPMYTKRDVMWRLWGAVAEKPTSPLAPRCIDCGGILGEEENRAGSPRHRVRCGERTPFGVQSGAVHRISPLTDRLMNRT